VLQPIGDEDEVYYQLVLAFKLLPGLRLDKLTVLQPCSGEDAYDSLEALIKHGNGWRELHYITPNSAMLGFATLNMFMADPYWRKPQPRVWNEILFSATVQSLRLLSPFTAPPNLMRPGQLLTPAHASSSSGRYHPKKIWKLLV
jgi:hypothetical protein